MIERKRICISTLSMITAFGKKDLRKIIFEADFSHFEALDLKSNGIYKITNLSRAYFKNMKRLMLYAIYKDNVPSNWFLNNPSKEVVASKLYQHLYWTTFVNMKQCHFIDPILKKMGYDELIDEKEILKIDLINMSNQLEEVRAAWNQKPREGKQFLYPLDKSLGFDLSKKEEKIKMMNLKNRN